MTNRIKQLAEQAGITTNLDTDYFEKDINKWVDYYSEKFAEMIVKEIFSEMAYQLFLHSDLQANDPGYKKAMSNTLKKLGIES